MSTRTPPRSASGSPFVAAMLALLLLAAGVVGLRDLVTGQGWADGTPWVPTAVDALDGLRPTSRWTVPVAILAVLLGLWLAVVAVKPRRRTHLPSPDPDLDLWIAPAALRHLANSVADRQPGVASSTTRIGRTLTVRLRVADGDRQGVEQTTRESIEHELAGLTTKPVHVHSQEAAS